MKLANNLKKIPKKNLKIVGFVGLIPVAIIGSFIYAAFFQKNDTSAPTKDFEGEAHINVNMNTKGKEVKKVTDQYQKMVEQANQEQAKKTINSNNSTGSYIALPNDKKVESTAFTVKDIEKSDKDKGVTKQGRTTDETKPLSFKSPLTSGEPKNSQQKTAPSSQGQEGQPTVASSSPLSANRYDDKQRQEELQRIREAKRKAYEKEVGRQFAMLQSLNKFWSGATPSQWQRVSKDGKKEASTSISVTPQQQTTAPAAASNNKSEDAVENVDVGHNRGTLGARALLPGDRILVTVQGDVNSDHPSPVTFTVAQGKLAGATLLGKFSTKGSNIVVQTSSITWKGHVSALNGLATDPSKDANYVTGDVDNHTLSRWVALASSYLIKGYSDALMRSGSVTQVNNAGVSTTTTPQYTNDELWVQAAGGLMTKGADIASAYFLTPPTIKLHSGDVFAILITKSLVADWLPKLVKGKDLL